MTPPEPLTVHIGVLPERILSPNEVPSRRDRRRVMAKNRLYNATVVELRRLNYAMRLRIRKWAMVDRRSLIRVEYLYRAHRPPARGLSVYYAPVDRDNAQTALKAMQDAIADELGFNDSRIDPHVTFGERSATDYGVTVTITFGS